MRLIKAMSINRALIVQAAAIALVIGADTSENAASAQSIIEALQNGAVIRVQNTDCHIGAIKKPTTLTVELSFSNGALLYKNLPAPGYSRGSTDTLPAGSAAGDTITIKGWSTAIIRLSADGQSCTYELQCGEGRNSR